MATQMRISRNRARVLAFVALSALLTHTALQLPLAVRAERASGAAGSSESMSSSQPLWSYQVKPNSYANTASGGGPSPSQQTAHYGNVGGIPAPPSLFEAFNGALSQRQGALTTSPFLSILPIILIAAGGLLLLLPMLTMMMASPFGGGGAFGAGAFNGPFGYPQTVGALNKRRSLLERSLGASIGGGGSGIIELLEQVGSAIDEMSRKHTGAAQQNKRAKSTDGVSNAQATKPPVNDAAAASSPPSSSSSSSSAAGATATGYKPLLSSSDTATNLT